MFLQTTEIKTVLQRQIILTLDLILTWISHIDFDCPGGSNNYTLV